METLAADENVYVGADEGIVVRYMFMNTQKAPFNDVRVRQAMNYAIDKDAYIAVVKNGLASKATSILGPATQHYKRNEPYAYDLEKARKLLTDAGYPDGFETSLICTTTTSDLKQCDANLSSSSWLRQALRSTLIPWRRPLSARRWRAQKAQVPRQR